MRLPLDWVSVITLPAEAKHFNLHEFYYYRDLYRNAIFNHEQYYAIPGFESRLALLEVTAEFSGMERLFLGKYFKSLSASKKDDMYSKVKEIFDGVSADSHHTGLLAEEFYRDVLTASGGRILGEETSVVLKNIFLSRVAGHRIAKLYQEVGWVSDGKRFERFLKGFLRNDLTRFGFATLNNVAMIRGLPVKPKFLFFYIPEYRFSKHIRIPVEYLDLAIESDATEAWETKVKPYLLATYPKLIRAEVTLAPFVRAWSTVVYSAYTVYMLGGFYHSGKRLTNRIRENHKVQSMDNRVNQYLGSKPAIPYVQSDSNRNVEWEEWKKKNPKAAAHPKSEEYRAEFHYIFRRYPEESPGSQSR